MNPGPSGTLYHGRGEPPAPEQGGRLPVALAFPGPASLALSTLGWQAVYRLLAAEPELAVERFFVTRQDMDAEPRSREAGRPLSRFPVTAASLNFEEDVLPLLGGLAAAGVPLPRGERPDFPLLMAGGPAVFMNPAPLAPFFDLLYIGEADDTLAGLLLDLKAHAFAGGSKADFLEAVKDRPGIYVPGKSPLPVPRRVAWDGSPRLADPAYSCFVSPEAEFKDALLLEVNRGCPYGCRFCAAGFIYRPPRHADMADLQAIVEATDPPKVGLVGTALTDWPDLLPFLEWLNARRTKFSLSSLRADGLTEEFLSFLRRCGVRTVTLALEGPSRRLRDAASKKLDEEDFLRAVELCARFGVNHLKIYLIVGWPGETEADYDELGEFLARISAARERGMGRRSREFLRLTVGASCLVPKPWTPLQWAPMASEGQLQSRLDRVRALVRPIKAAAFAADSPAAARLQGLLARGGEELSGLILEAVAARSWKKALARWDGDPSLVLDRERAEDEPFPWEAVDLGVSRAHLLRQWRAYRQARPSPPCPPEGCAACGRCGLAPS